MAYNTRAMLRDSENNAVPQYWNELEGSYEVIEGIGGALKVSPVDSTGNYVNDSLNEIISKLIELIGVVS